MRAQPFAHEFLITLAPRLIGVSRSHTFGAADFQRLSNIHPIFVSVLDTRHSVFAAANDRVGWGWVVLTQPIIRVTAFTRLIRGVLVDAVHAARLGLLMTVVLQPRA